MHLLLAADPRYFNPFCKERSSALIRSLQQTGTIGKKNDGSLNLFGIITSKLSIISLWQSRIEEEGLLSV